MCCSRCGPSNSRCHTENWRDLIARSPLKQPYYIRLALLSPSIDIRRPTLHLSTVVDIVILPTHQQTKDFQVRPPTDGNAEFSVFNVASRSYSFRRHIEGSMINSISELLYEVTFNI